MPLPRLVWPSEQVGVVTAAAAHETGLRAGTPVVAGTIDAWAEAFSAGVRAEGDLMLMYGSTMFLVQVAERAAPNAVLWLTEGVEPGRHTLAAGMSTSGTLVDWMRELVGAPPWDELIADAARIPAGARGLLVLPYLAGERTPVYDPHARGVVAGLTLTHGRAELMRAGYEAIGFGIRHILSAFESPARVVAVGGGTRAALWTQIVSDIAGVTQLVPEQTVGASYGDALLAAIGAGLVPPETDWTRPGAVFEPDPATGAVYADLYELYLELYRTTMGIAHRLAALQASL